MKVNEQKYPLPSFLHAALTFGSIILVIAVGLFTFKVSLHVLLVLCIAIASTSAFFLTRGKFAEIREAMNSGISRAFAAIYIFILIGVLIAALIQAGTVSILIYYGIQFISPGIFLPTALILCAIMSIVTGTSWGTAGTAGVVLIGVGGAMGIPLPVVAGVIVSGAAFGDKMSPVSDTTNLAAMSSETDLYKHIGSMIYTTFPAFIITLIAYSVIGIQYSSNAIVSNDLIALTHAIEHSYNLNLICLLPLVIMLGLSISKISAEPTMLVSAVVAVFIALLVQHADIITILNALYQGGGGHETGVKALDSLLSRGGITSMMWTLSLSLLALALGGILHTYSFISVLLSSVLKAVKSVSGLVTTTILSCFFGNLLIGEAYMSIILVGQLFSRTYDDKKIDRSVLSRSLEEGATLTTVIIPWTTAGAFFAATLGVNVVDYAPWAILNWINPVIGILFSVFGIAIFRSEPARKKELRGCTR